MMTWFNIIKGGRKPAFKKWLRLFIREHLESMEVGEIISSKEMVEVVEEKKSEGTYLSPISGGRGRRRPEMQIRFGSGRATPKVTINLIGNLIGENKDIVKRLWNGWERI
jgi:hypothetical protein